MQYSVRRATVVYELTRPIRRHIDLPETTINAHRVEFNIDAAREMTCGRPSISAVLR